MKPSASKVALASCLLWASATFAQTPPSYYERPVHSSGLPAQPQAKASEVSGSESYGYAGAAVGYSRFSADSYSFSSGTPFDNLDGDNNDFAFKFYGGYRFNKILALEGGWMTLGETSSNYSAPLIPGFRGDVSYSARAAYLAGVLALPITPNLSIYGKAGPLLAWVRTNYSYTGLYGTTSSSNTSDTNLSLLWGGGVDYYWNRNFGIRLEYENYGNVVSGGNVSAQAVYLGLNFRF